MRSCSTPSLSHWTILLLLPLLLAVTTAKAAEPPALGKNTIIVTHYPNIAEAYPQEANGLVDGEALILHPDGQGGAPVVARVKIDEWAGLTTTP
jgi:hypothetical protein